MIYFDNSATGRYKPNSVVKAVIDSLRRSSNSGRSAHKDAIREAERVHETRLAVKSFVGAGKDKEVVFTKNTTEALNLAIMSMARKGHIVTTLLEHNSVLRPLRYLVKNYGTKVTYLTPQRDGTISAKELENSIGLDTYLFVVNNMSNVTGSIQNIEELAAVASRKGVLVLVDGAQSLGQLSFEMDKWGVDMLAGCGHKGLHSPQGIGFLVYNKRLHLSPMLYGGTGTDSFSLEQPYSPPESLEAGTLNGLGITGLQEGLIWTENNLSKIIKKKEELSNILMKGLTKIKGIRIYTAYPNGIVSFNVQDIPSSVIADILSEKYDIATRSGLQCAPLTHRWLNTEKQGIVRVSIGYNNSKSDIKKLIAAVAEIASEGD